MLPYKAFHQNCSNKFITLHKIKETHNIIVQKQILQFDLIFLSPTPTRNHPLYVNIPNLPHSLLQPRTLSTRLGSCSAKPWDHFLDFFFLLSSSIYCLRSKMVSDANKKKVANEIVDILDFGFDLHLSPEMFK